MKIENNGLQPVSSKKTEGIHASDKKKTGVDSRSAAAPRDSVVLTESARLLAKARISLETTPELENERLEALRQQIDSGTYTIPYQELAKRLSTLLKPDAPVGE